MNAPRKRTAILISGRGSNMAALIAAAKERDFPAEIVGVVSSRADARGLAIAQAENIPARALEQKDFADKAAYDGALDEALEEMGAELVCLAGYMRMLLPGFVAKWAGRLINIHPSLLPLFPGLHTHRRALTAGVALHGCTVHFVTAEVDAGPIIAQAAVPVVAGESESELAARVLKVEHRLYPQALAMVASGAAWIEAGRTRFADGFGRPGERALVWPEPEREGAVDLESLARFTP